MRQNATPHFVFCIAAALATILTSCGPATLIVPTSTPTSTATAPPPTGTPPRITSESGLFEAGKSYRDTSADMQVSFLDVVGFRATVQEESETLEVVLQLRDIPPTVLRGQVINFVEYMWEVSIFLDAATAGERPDFGIIVTAVEQEITSGEGVQPTKVGTAELVPFEEVWNDALIYSATGEGLGQAEVTADPARDTLTLRGRVPGITASAVFRFSTFYLDSTMDWPDGYVPATEAAEATPEPETPVTITGDGTQLVPVGAVRAYPGPMHYEGDVLTFEIKTGENFGGLSGPVRLALDEQAPREVKVEELHDRIVLPLALDTSDLAGTHTVTLSTGDGTLQETYTLEVLPANERPPNEARAEWMTREIDCCILHYIAETAAARDIDFLSDGFAQAAREFTMVTGTEIDQKLDVYILDTIWGNGGFGGNGELVISYTDRYYGPTIGSEGLETLARHEFTHATDIGQDQPGDGVAFNYEGWAVYVAGGHYKPEPLAERGAALYDLGHYVPVGQFIQQHELSYLYAAVVLTYIADTYGEEKIVDFLGADDNLEDDQPGALDVALQNTFGISRQEFEQGFQAWLESKDPGPQLDDLRLTVELQDLRRRYQETYAPPPYFLLARAVDAAAHPDYLPVVIREARAPANVAVELMIAHSQLAIVEADYARAEALNRILENILSTGSFADPLAQDYCQLALLAANAGYEIMSLELHGNQASARVTMNPPNLKDMKFSKVDGVWQIEQ